MMRRTIGMGKDRHATAGAGGKTMDLNTALTALQQHAKFTEDKIVPRFRTLLPQTEK
jgi:hypothetical protein